MPMTAHGTFFWNELMTWSVDKAKAFYQETLGWQYESHPMADGKAPTRSARPETPWPPAYSR